MISISIIIPVYNKAAVVADTIASVLGQDQVELEIIVVDDGSTDGSRSVIESMADGRIHLFAIPNSGPGAARNYGIRQASGQWIMVLDADDILLPGALRFLLDAAATWPQADLIAGNYVIAESNSDRLAYMNCKKGMIANPYKEWFYKKFIPCAGTYICKREIMLSYPYMDCLRRSEDVEMLFRLFKSTRCARILHPVMKYRRVHSSASRRFPPIENEFMGYLSFDMDKPLWEKICLYECYVEAKNFYPEESARLYGSLRRRFFLILAYHIAFWHRALCKKQAETIYS